MSRLIQRSTRHYHVTIEWYSAPPPIRPRRWEGPSLSVQSTDALTIVAQAFPALSEAQMARLRNAHPRCALRVAATPADFAAMVPEADAVMTVSWLTPDLLSRARRLRWLQFYNAGPTLLPELAASPLTITAAKGPLGITVAEQALALLFGLARRLPFFVQAQGRREWARNQGPKFLQLNGATVVVLGLGAVGSEIARVCQQGLRMRVLGFARTRRECPSVDEYVEPGALHAALGAADCVFLALPGTADTRHIIDASALAAMKSTAYIINVGRGTLIDEAALISALEEGRIAGAGLDVFEGEPLPPESRLWTLPNVLVTPHVANQSGPLLDEWTGFIAENIRRFGAGEVLLGAVDKQAGY